MAFHNVRLPEDLSYGFVGGPKFSTTVAGSEAGYEQRIGHWTNARREWTVGAESWDRPRLEQLLAFFIARQGKLHSFRFKDWQDYFVGMEHVPGTGLVVDTDNLQVIGDGDGVEDTFQLVKTYTSGPTTVTRTITRPVAGVKIYKDGVEQTSGVTVNYSTGAVVFTSPPANGTEIAWAGQFDVPARFDMDFMELDLTVLAKGKWQGIRIIEVRE